MLQIVLCEDNQKVLLNYEHMINKIIKDNNIDACISFTTSSVAEFEEYLETSSDNLFLMDIDLKASRTGFDLAKDVRKKNKKAYIVFMTGHLEYVFQSFKVRPFNFMPKPVQQEVLESTIMDVYKDYIENSIAQFEKLLEIKSGGVLHKVKISDILCIQRDEAKSIFHFANAKIYSNEPLSSIYDKINDIRFVRCHKSFVCNKDFISEMRLAKSEILLKNGMKVDIGRGYKKDLLGNK